MILARKRVTADVSTLLAQLLENYVIHELKNQMFLVRISLKKKELAGACFCYFRLIYYFQFRGGSRGRVQGVRTPQLRLPAVF